MPARGKGHSPGDRPRTLELSPVDAAPDFHGVHECRAKPKSVRVVQVPPHGWQLRGARYLIFAVAFCPFCGLALKVSP